LQNGLDVYLYPDKKVKNTAIETTVKVGMKAEDEKNAGISHLVEHIVFRDKRLEDRDYVDLFEKEGASYVNGYTSFYTTRYVTTIKSEKSYWIVKQFAQMLLDKNITKDDLEAERGALQVEIGAFTWADKYAPTIEHGLDFIKELFPSRYDFYKDEFGLDIKDDDKKLIPRSIYRLNNQKFSFDDVMKYYNDYYYPSNMTLKIVGNFDLPKMKETIEKSFGNFPRSSGKSVENKLYKTAKLNKKPYEQYAIGINSNRAIIGTKFIVDDPKKLIVLKSYVNNLAQRLSKVFRNKNGESYDVHGSYERYQNAALATISFNAKHNSFDKNIKYTQQQIAKESNGNLSNETILKALQDSEKEFDSYGHDYLSLMHLIINYQDFNKLFGDEKTPYEVLKEITPKEFKTILKDSFTDQNRYKFIIRDYSFFPHEVTLFSIFIILIMFYFIDRFFGAKIHKRIMFERRLTSRFISLLVIISAIFISALITEWIYYFVTKALPIGYLWKSNYDAPLSYIQYLLDFIISLLVLYFVVKKLYSWFYIKLFITDDSLILSGVKNIKIATDDIKDINITKWKPSLFTKVYGLSPLFWKPLVEITLKNNTKIYVRAKNAKHLKDDLNFIINRG